MKTQIIHLESHDDVASIRDRMSWSKCQELLLVWPSHNASLHTRLDLELLARHARQIGARLAFVVRQPDVLMVASQLGIPAFRSIRQARQIPWQLAGEPDHAQGRLLEARRKRRTPRPGRPVPPQLESLSTGWRLAIFGLGLAGFLALLSVAIPRATIALRPQTRSQTLELSVSAESSLVSFNIAGRLASRQVEIIVEGRQSIPASGQIPIPLAAASGTVVLSNLTDETLTIPAGTVLRTAESPPQRFATSAQVMLPGLSAVEVQVHAEAPGEAGNLPADSPLSVEGDLGLKLAAANPTAFAGGREQVSAAPALEDYDSLRAALLDALWRSALQEVGDNPQAAGLLLSTEPERVSILQEEFTPAEPQPANELSLRLRVAFTVVVVPQDQLEAFGQTVMDAAGPAGFVGIPSSFSASVIDIPQKQEDGKYRLTLLLSRSLQAHIDALEVAALAAGKTPMEAVAVLSESLRLESAPEIRLNLAWWPLLPWLPSQIQVTQ
ncbi:MAG: baseplate J/gp47 family protein [Chloroflexi bacterium]|nr:baseplate J/gp47 family protein [Chloroflexota bacterium]